MIYKRTKATIIVMQILTVFFLTIVGNGCVQKKEAVTPSMPEQKELQDIFNRVNPAIARIIHKSIFAERYLGTGFIVDPDGVVITNCHAINSFREINVRLADGRTYPVTSVIYSDINLDVCILKIDADKLPAIPFADSNALQWTDGIYYMGHSSDSKYSLIKSSVDGKHTFYDYFLFSFNASLSPMDSGGPLINFQGQAIGLIIFPAKKGQDRNFALPINKIRSRITQIPKISLKEFAKSTSKAYYYFSEANGLSLRGDSRKAIASYRRAININPHFADAYLQLGTADWLGLTDGKNYAKAIAEFTKQIRKDPGPPDTYYKRGFAHLCKGELGQAISDYTTAIKINPDFTEAYQLRGRAYQNKGNLELALSDYIKAIEINPFDRFEKKFTVESNCVSLELTSKGYAAIGTSIDIGAKVVGRNVYIGVVSLYSGGGAEGRIMPASMPEAVVMLHSSKIVCELSPGEYSFYYPPGFDLQIKSNLDNKK